MGLPFELRDDKEIGGHLPAKGRHLQLLVAQQHLDDVDNDLFVPAGGWPSCGAGCGGHALVDLGCLCGKVNGAVDLACGQRVRRAQAREEPAIAADLALGMLQAPPGATRRDVAPAALG